MHGTLHQCIKDAYFLSRTHETFSKIDLHNGMCQLYSNKAGGGVGLTYMLDHKVNLNKIWIIEIKLESNNKKYLEHVYYIQKFTNTL